MDRLTKINYPGSNDASFGYDQLGRRTSMTDATGTTYWYYDSYGGYTYKHALIAVSQPTSAGAKVFQYRYDQVGNRTQMIDPAGNTASYAYDANDRLSTFTIAPGLTASYQYDYVGNRTRVTYPNGAYTEYAYNARNWATSVTSRNSAGSVLASYSYLFDNVGNPTRMTEQDGSYTDWVYDNVYQLASDVRRTSGGSTIYSRTFSYDQVGNRTQMVQDGVPVTYTYDANNKMLTAGGDSYTYDANGNTIGRTGSSGNASWTYDYENRMISSTTPQGSASFVYNGDGLRVQKTEAGVVRKYLFDGVRIYSEHDASMTEQGRFMMESDSYYSPLTAMRIGNAGVWYYPLYDSLGSTRRLINASQTVTDSYSYDAFGNITSQSGSTYNPYRYVGSLGYYSADTTTGLLHLGARYYNPVHGRFTSRDPFDGAVEVPGTFNRYLYELNDPTASVDPAGYGIIACLRCFWCTNKILEASLKCRHEHPELCEPRETDVRMIDPVSRMAKCIQKHTRKNYITYCTGLCVKCWGPYRPGPPRARV